MNVKILYDDDQQTTTSAGRDAIEDFDFVGHSKSARELMETYLMGELDPSSVPQQQQEKATTNRSSHSKVYRIIISFQILVGHSCHFCDCWLSVIPQ